MILDERNADGEYYWVDYTGKKHLQTEVGNCHWWWQERGRLCGVTLNAYRVDLREGDTRQIADPIQIVQSVWHPDGKFVEWKGLRDGRTAALAWLEERIANWAPLLLARHEGMTCHWQARDEDSEERHQRIKRITGR